MFPFCVLALADVVTWAAMVANGSARRGCSCSSCAQAVLDVGEARADAVLMSSERWQVDGVSEVRRARCDGAVKVQVVERVVIEVRERRIKVPHPRSDCINAVLADDDLMVSVICALTALV